MHSIKTRKSELGSIMEIVHRYARRFAMPGVIEPDDIVQDAMLKVLARKTDRPPNSHWLYKVVRSVAYDAGRKHRRESKFLTSLSGARLTGSVCELADEYGAVVLGGRQKEIADGSDYDMDALTAALQQLKPLLREPLTLYAAGASYRDIADKSGANVGTVRSRLHYARKQAQQLLRNLS